VLKKVFKLCGQETLEILLVFNTIKPFFSSLTRKMDRVLSRVRVKQRTYFPLVSAMETSIFGKLS